MHSILRWNLFCPTPIPLHTLSPLVCCFFLFNERIILCFYSPRASLHFSHKTHKSNTNLSCWLNGVPKVKNGQFVSFSLCDPHPHHSVSLRITASSPRIQWSLLVGVSSALTPVSVFRHARRVFLFERTAGVQNDPLFFFRMCKVWEGSGLERNSSEWGKSVKEEEMLSWWALLGV